MVSRIANEEGRYRESEDYLLRLTKNIAFPENLQGDLYATWADFYLKQGKNNDAILNLKKIY